MVRSYHRIELATHRANENCIGGKWSIDPSGARGGCKQRAVLVSESAAIATVRIERAECDPRLTDAEPAAQSISRDARGLCYRGGSQLLAHLAQRNVRRGKNDAKLIRREHHRDAGTRQVRQHFRVPRIVISACEQCRLVDRRRDNAVNASRHRQFHCAFNCEAGQLPGQLGVAIPTPPTHTLGDVDACSLRADDHNVTALADQLVSERFGDDLRSNSAGIPDGHGKTRFHTYILSDT